MPKFPTYERNVGISGGSTASYASDSAFTAPARALANAGDALAGIGSDFLAIEQKVRQTQDDTWVSKARADTALQMDENERSAQKDATDGANGYTDRVRGTFDEYRKGKLAEAPSQRAARMYQEWSDRYNVDLTRRSASFQAESELAKRTSDFAEAMNAHAQLIYADPTQYDVVAKRAEADLQAAKAWMTPEQEEAARAKIDHDLKLSRAKSLVDFSPADFQREVGVQDGATVSGDQAVNAVVHRIIGAESGGDPNAKNPNSSASGVGQFTDSTWLATVRKHRPDLAGQSDAQLLQMKKDASLGKEMTTRLTEDNAKSLASAGHAVTAGNLYLAHFAGIGGANALLNAPDDQSVASVLGPEVMKANGFLNGMSVGDIKAWAAKKMGGKTGPLNVPNDPRYAGLSVDEIRSLSNQADTAVNAERATAYASLKDSMEQGVATGSILSEAQIINSGLNGGDVATLLGKYRTAQNDSMSVAATLEAIAGQSWSGDAFAAKDRKSIDGAAAAVKAKATPEQYQAFTEETVRQSGIVPQDVVNDLRRGLQSRNAQDVAAAAQRASRISSIDPAALGRRDGGSEIQRAADDFGFYVNKLNMSPEEAGKRLADDNDHDKQRDRKALEPAAKEFLKQVSEDDLGSVFDESNLPLNDPSLGFSPDQELGLKADYLAIAENEFYRANGDPDRARNRAQQQMKLLYGPTNITGDATVIKHPPERYWPANTETADPYGYVKDQIFEQYQDVIPDEDIARHYSHLVAPDDKENIAKIKRQFMESGMKIVSTTQTDAMVKRGEMPSYQVMFKDFNGVYQTLPGKAFVPDGAPLKAAKQTQIDRARAMQGAEKVKAKIKSSPDGGRDISLDAFINGDPLTGLPKGGLE